MPVSLSGGLSSDPLYYSSTSSIGYQAANTLDNSIKSEFTLPQYQFDNTPTGTANTDTNNGSDPVLVLATNHTTVTAANYSLIIDASTGPSILNISNNTGNGTSVLAGSGGGQIYVSDNSNATIVAGDGNYWIGHHNATGNLDITLGNGNDTINDLFGNSTITTGTGSNLINLYSGTANITLDGTADTVNAGVEGAAPYDAGDQVNISVASGSSDGVLVSENLSHISFTNGDGTSTIRGGNGSTTINAGGTGAVLYSAESYDFFIGGASPSTLSDSVTDNSTSNDTLIAGAGTTTVNALNSSGNVLLESGTGDSTLEGGSGNDTFEITGLTDGSNTVTIDNWTSNDTLELQGFGGSTLTNTPAAGTIATSDGSTIVTLNDGTTLIFTNYTNTSDITAHTTSI